jgi:hypothetical protein
LAVPTIPTSRLVAVLSLYAIMNFKRSEAVRTVPSWSMFNGIVSSPALSLS